MSIIYSAMSVHRRMKTTCPSLKFETLRDGCAPGRLYTTVFIHQNLPGTSRGCCTQITSSSLSLFYLVRLIMSLARRWRQQYFPEQQYAMVNQHFVIGVMEMSLMSGHTILMLLEGAVSLPSQSPFYPSSSLSIELSYSG
jgi:hypothetical protein